MTVNQVFNNIVLPTPQKLKICRIKFVSFDQKKLFEDDFCCGAMNPVESFLNFFCLLIFEIFRKTWNFFVFPLILQFLVYFCWCLCHKTPYKQFQSRLKLKLFIFNLLTSCFGIIKTSNTFKFVIYSNSFNWLKAKLFIYFTSNHQLIQLNFILNFQWFA